MTQKFEEQRPTQYDAQPSSPEPHTRRWYSRPSVAVALLAITLAMWGWNMSRQIENLVFAQSINGFNVSNATIPKDEILSGGPPRDGIPAILDPQFVKADNVNFLNGSDQVVGLTINGVSKAYPLRILVWHEIVNDEIGGVPVAVTYCPLCGTAMVFHREAKGRELTFGVSGLLYNNDVLMYDHQTESLWSQLKTEAVAGIMVRQPLQWMPSDLMSWKAWQSEHPQSMVLSTETGFDRNYAASPYLGYEITDETLFPVPKNRSDLENKEWVLGVLVNGTPKAYAIDALREADEPLKDNVGGTDIAVQYSEEQDHATVTNARTQEVIPSVRVYWFAWQAFYPKTQLHKG